jgi:hypothetical protein
MRRIAFAFLLVWIAAVSPSLAAAEFDRTIRIHYERVEVGEVPSIRYTSEYQIGWRESWLLGAWTYSFHLLQIFRFSLFRPQTLPQGRYSPPNFTYR